MNYQVEYIEKKNSSAIIRDGIIVLRISSFLNSFERQNHIDSLIKKIEKKSDKGFYQNSLFENIYRNSQHTFFNNKTYSFFIKGHKQSGIFLNKENNQVIFYVSKYENIITREISFSQGLANRYLSQSMISRMIYMFAKAYFYKDLTEEIKYWYFLTKPKRKLNDIKIKQINSRWGSCSTRGNINISLKTLLLPYNLFSSVCLHEVAHLEEMNHSIKYWNVVLKYMGDYDERKKEVGRYC